VALEQMRERRRALASLTAAGVPVKVLARSLLWQMAVPVLPAVVVSVLTGLVMTLLVFRLTPDPVTMDWPGGAAALVLLVTLSTLPALRAATRLDALRTE
jgi:uncharacterized membrane protein (DUF485 family)